MKLYLVEGSQGEYDDYCNWVVGVFSSRERAKKACQKIVDDDKFDDRTGKLNWTYDPHKQRSVAFTIGRYRWDRTEYDIIPITLDKLEI